MDNLLVSTRALKNCFLFASSLSSRDHIKASVIIGFKFVKHTRIHRLCLFNRDYWIWMRLIEFNDKLGD